MLSGKWSTKKILRRLFGFILNGTIFAVIERNREAKKIENLETRH